MRQASAAGIGVEALGGVSLDRLGDAGELALIRLIAQWPRQVEAAAMAHEPHRIAFYLYDLAAAFHAHWKRGRGGAGAAVRRSRAMPNSRGRVLHWYRRSDL